MPVNEQEELDQFLNEHICKRYIIPSKSLIAFSVFFIKKKDGQLCLIQDYWKINEFTIKNQYLLLLVSDIINHLCQARYFTKFDVRWGYTNIHIRAGDRWKAAFTTNRGLFKPQVMLFGLTNSPATFQALMNTIFTNLVAAGKVAVYLDDILIYSHSLHDHQQVTHKVLQHLADHDLYLHPKKCEFEQPQVKYLSLVICKGEVSMDPIKVQAITNWLYPRNLCDLHSFLGFTNFYHQFLKNFAQITYPLNNLTKKDVHWCWSLPQHEAFHTLKRAFLQHPILVMWDLDWPTQIKVDASGFATGGILLQQLGDKLWHPVTFRSESMADAEWNYEIYDKEMLGIIHTLENWQYYLKGLPQAFDIITDHCNLQYWQTTQNLSHQQACWSLYLSQFDFHLTHKPGSANTQANPLSHLPTHFTSNANDNHFQLVLSPDHFAHATTLLDTVSHNLEQLLCNTTERDPEVLLALKSLKEHGPHRLANTLLDWDEHDGLVFFKG